QVRRRWVVLLTLPGFVGPDEIVVVKLYTVVVVALDRLGDGRVAAWVEGGTAAGFGSGGAAAWGGCTPAPLYAATNRCSGWAPDSRNHERPVRVALDPCLGNPTLL